MPAVDEDWAERLEFLEPDGEGRDLMLSNPPRLIRASLYLMTALVCTAFLWAWFSKVDIYISSIGAVRPEGDLVKVQASATGRVTSVHVEDGQKVSKGDLLFVLDQRESETALGQVETELGATRARRAAQERSFDSLNEERAARLASADIAIENAQAVLARAQEEQTSLAAAVDEAEEVAASALLAKNRAETLFSSGIVSEAAKESAISTWRVAESALRSANATFDAGSQSVRSAEKNLQLSVQQAEVIRREQERQSESLTSQVELLKAQESTLSLEQEKIAEGLELLEIRSPVDGTITTVSIRNADEFAQLGLTLATIAPVDARWIVESWVPNRDAGALRDNLGTEVKIKFDAFPFRDYGYLRGKLIEISPDAELIPLLGDAFRVRISLDSLEIGRAGRRGEVRLGMTVTADIVKEEERVLLLLFRKVRDRISYE